MPTGLLAAMQLCDSALPTGAFAHSFGFESYLDAGVIADAEGFAAWLEAFVRQQLTYSDALAICLATSGDPIRVDQLLTAQALPAEVRAAGMTMGRRLLEVCRDNYPSAALDRYHRALEAGEAFGHPAIVWAIAARDLGIGVDEAVAQHLYATIIALTQNAVRAVPLGQRAGQSIIRRAQSWVSDAVEASSALGEADLGATVPGLEIAQMRHATQRARVFMS